jgi:hypothetical protein
VTIAQSGNDLTAEMVSSGMGSSGMFYGVALPDINDTLKGEAGLVSCSTNLAGTARWKAKTKDDGSGSLKGTMIFVSTGSPDGVVTCKYSLKRTSTMAPTLTPCF